jgi:hypothetical protein
VARDPFNNEEQATISRSRPVKLRMAVSAGIRIGPYEIVAPPGAGGTVEKVYKARDAT